MERFRLRMDAHSNFETSTPKQRRNVHLALFGAISLIRIDRRTIRLELTEFGSTPHLIPS